MSMSISSKTQIIIFYMVATNIFVPKFYSYLKYKKIKYIFSHFLLNFNITVWVEMMHNYFILFLFF